MLQDSACTQVVAAVYWQRSAAGLHPGRSSSVLAMVCSCFAVAEHHKLGHCIWSMMCHWPKGHDVLLGT